MAVSSLNRVMQRICQAVADADRPYETDADLLGRFLSKRDSHAVSLLIGRHAPMVWGVCSRILGHRQNAEDAFQATFLVLLRKANTIKPHSMVGNWLHGVAVQTARKARAMTIKRSTRERPTDTLPEPPAAAAGDHPMLAFLDEELNRLPDKYRVALVACDLQGKTRAEAAQELGWAEGTVASRLARGRQMLARRLGRHGTTVSVAAVSGLLANNVVSATPVSVVSATVQACIPMVMARTIGNAGFSQQVITLAEGVLKTMLLTKLKIATLVLMTLVLFGSGVGMFALPAQAEQKSAKHGPVEPAVPENKAPRTEQEKLHGTWTLAETQKHGEKVPAKDIPIKPHKLVIDGDKIPKDPRSPQTLDPTARAVVFHHDNGSEDGDVRLNATRNPKEITMTWFLSQWLCIYKVEGDTLTICYNPKNNVRPDEFRTSADSDRVLFIYHRAKARQEPQLKAPTASEKKDSDDETIADAAPRSDIDRIQGQWVSTACEMDGTELTGKQGDDFHFDPSFDGKNYEIQFGKIRMEGTFELNPTSKPKAITLKGSDGSTNLGIYSLDAGKLRICICDTKKEGRRPTEFRTKAGSGHSLILFKRGLRESEVKEVVERFLKAALAGDTEKARALAAPAVSDQQIARFKGLTRTLPITNLDVTGPAPTSHGNNAGRALVVTDEVEVTDGRGKTKGRVVLTLLMDDERLETRGWLVWDIDLADDARIEKARKFVERTQPKREAPSPVTMDGPANGAVAKAALQAADLELLVGKELQYRTKDNPKLRPVPLAGVSKLLRDGQSVVLRVRKDVPAELVTDLIKMSLQRKKVMVTVLPLPEVPPGEKETN